MCVKQGTGVDDLLLPATSLRAADFMRIHWQTLYTCDFFTKEV
ncbi:MAG: hypothetical protein ACYSU0_18855 [Planctomycetota bacterium]